MTIRRQYQLPNCSLVLDGLSIDPEPGNEDVMSLLVNAECRISGLERSINGGYNFFAALVRAVSQYGQELLSGFAHPQVIEGEPLLVHINPGDGPYHHLVVQPEIADLGGSGDGRAIDIKLSAVQLFDLTEAVDQFFDDRQTLPELEPALSPLARRFVRTEEPLSDRAIPAVIGVGGLVAATMALGLLPVPELRDPVTEVSPSAEISDVIDGNETDVSSDTPPTGETTPPVTTTVDADEVATALTGDDTEEVAEEAAEAVAVSDGESEVDEPAETALAETAEDVEDEASEAAPATDDGETFESFDEFDNGADSDADSGGNGVAVAASTYEDEPTGVSRRSFGEIQTINGQLKDTIVENRGQPRFGDAISYRIRVNEAGEILGYQPLDATSESSIDETPLTDLINADADADETVDYRVVFTERGVVELSPYWGWSFYE
ncbi:MAG: DUF4335 domain-containing protein [Cyanobacteria bacterium J06607_10]